MTLSLLMLACLNHYRKQTIFELLLSMSMPIIIICHDLDDYLVSYWDISLIRILFYTCSDVHDELACAHEVVSQQCDDNRDAIRLFQGVRYRTMRPMLQKYDCDIDPGEGMSCTCIINFSYLHSLLITLDFPQFIYNDNDNDNE